MTRREHKWVEPVGPELHDRQVTFDPAEAAEAAKLMKRIVSAPHGWEMLTRIGQSLELTDALWELVPFVCCCR
jgi:hypothetical protein